MCKCKMQGKKWLVLALINVILYFVAMRQFNITWYANHQFEFGCCWFGCWWPVALISICAVVACYWIWLSCNWYGWL